MYRENSAHSIFRAQYPLSIRRTKHHCKTQAVSKYVIQLKTLNTKAMLFQSRYDDATSASYTLYSNQSEPCNVIAATENATRTKCTHSPKVKFTNVHGLSGYNRLGNQDFIFHIGIVIPLIVSESDNL